MTNEQTYIFSSGYASACAMSRATPASSSAAQLNQVPLEPRLACGLVCHGFPWTSCEKLKVQHKYESLKLSYNKFQPKHTELPTLRLNFPQVACTVYGVRAIYIKNRSWVRFACACNYNLGITAQEMYMCDRVTGMQSLASEIWQCAQSFRSAKSKSQRASNTEQTQG